MVLYDDKENYRKLFIIKKNNFFRIIYWTNIDTNCIKFKTELIKDASISCYFSQAGLWFSINKIRRDSFFLINSEYQLLWVFYLKF